MSKEFLDNRVDMAHNSLDEGDPATSIGLLKNLKLRIHDADVEKEIKDFENKTDTELEMHIKELRGSDRDELRINKLISDEVLNTARKYIDFYDQLLKEYDVY